MAKHKKLYEITALLSYSVVIAASSKKAAMDHIKTWEICWTSSDFIGVSDVSLVAVREPRSQDNLEDEAHEVI